MIGGYTGTELKKFWDHCFQHEEWRDHPAKLNPNVTKDRFLPCTCLDSLNELDGQHVPPPNKGCRWRCQGLIPLTLHIDGAEVYSNSEFYVWSVGSCLASGEVWAVHAGFEFGCSLSTL